MTSHGQFAEVYPDNGTKPEKVQVDLEFCEDHAYDFDLAWTGLSIVIREVVR